MNADGRGLCPEETLRPVSDYTVRLEWRNAINDRDAPLRELEAKTFQDAKFEAALLYVGEDFKGPPPSAYVILQNGLTEVYRYPEVRA